MSTFILQYQDPITGDYIPIPVIQGDQGFSIASITLDSYDVDGNAIYNVFRSDDAVNPMNQIVVPKGDKGDKGERGESFRADEIVSTPPTSTVEGWIVLYIGTTSGSWVENHLYIYTSSVWHDLGSIGGGGGIEDAPTDGGMYSRQNTDWTKIFAPTNMGGANSFLMSNGSSFVWQSQMTTTQANTGTEVMPRTISAATLKEAIENHSPAYILPAATTTTLGGVKPDGTSITVTADGTISGASTYVLPVATTSTLGGIKIGSGFTMAVDVLSVNFSGYVTETQLNTNHYTKTEIDTKFNNVQTAYQYAVAGGYLGTESKFKEDLASLYNLADVLAAL